MNKYEVWSENHHDENEFGDVVEALTHEEAAETWMQANKDAADGPYSEEVRVYKRGSMAPPQWFEVRFDWHCVETFDAAPIECPECDEDDGPCWRCGKYCPGCGKPDDEECVCCSGCKEKIKNNREDENQ